MPQDTETKIAELKRQVEELKRTQLQYPLDPRNKRVIHQDLPVVKSISGNNWTFEVNDIEHQVTLGGSGAKTATFVVGPASNSDSDLYDYTTDGTADDVEIQAAIDALPSTGGTVLLREGTYTIDYTAGIEINSSKNGVHLMGMGRGTIVAFENSISTDARMISLSGSYCKITDIYFDGNKANVAGGAGASQYLVNIGANGEVSRSYFVNARGSALVTGDGTIVHGNFFINNNPTPNDGSDYIIQGGAHNTISCNYFSQDDTLVDYTYVSCSNSSVVEANIMILPDDFTGGVIVVTEAGVISGNVISENTATGTGDNAFTAIQAGGNNCSVTGNTVVMLGGATANASKGVLIDGDNCTVSGNHISGVNGNGIYSNANYAVIADNNIYDCAEAGIIIEDDYGVVKGNVILNVGQATNDTYAGISIDSVSSYSTIVGNTVNSTTTNKHKYGVREEGASSPSVIGDNVLRNAVTANLSTQSGSTVTSNNITA